MDILGIDLEKLRPTVLGWLSSWHSKQPWLLPFVNYEYISKDITATGTPFVASVPQAMTVVSWAQAIRVETTNNSSNYWTVSLYRVVDTSTAIEIAKIDTTRLTAGTWYNESVTINGGILSTDLFLYVYAVKTSSPGGLRLAGPMVWAR